MTITSTVPMVSVIIPTFNRAARVQRAIDSVLRQSFFDFELIVIDDGSTDQTRQWLSGWQDPRLRLFFIDHQGVAAARNFGAHQAQAAWLCFLDSDDVWHRHKLSEQIRYHHNHPHILISQTDDIWIRDSVRVNKMKHHSVRSGNIFKESLVRCLVCASSVMLQKELFFQVGAFDESLATCEDYDLWLRILAHHEIGFVTKRLVTKFGGHTDQLSKKYPFMDQYRVFALERLLTSDLLSIEQTKMVNIELARKRAILNRAPQKST